MSEMVERVAEAIRKASAEKSAGERRSVEYYVGVGIDQFRHAPTADAYDKLRAELFEAAARAAIEVMREPTEMMGEAAYNERGRQHEQNPASESSPCPGEPDGNEYWHVMIDAALKD